MGGRIERLRLESRVSSGEIVLPTRGFRSPAMARPMSKGIEVGAVLPTARQLGRRALSLGVANAFDYAIQFLVPVVLVRCLDAADFGDYRLLWLAVGTVMAVATLAMPGSLYYFLPRSDRAP